MKKISSWINLSRLVWLIAVLLISLFSGKYVMIVTGKLTDVLIGNNRFIYLLVLLFHLLTFYIMGSTCFNVKKSSIIGVLSVFLVFLLRKTLGGDGASYITVIEAYFFVFTAGHVCFYFIRENAKCFFLLCGEGALFFMHFLVPVFNNFSLTLLAALIAIAFWTMPRIYHEPEMQLFMTRKARIYFILLDIYASFALVGHNAFLKNVSPEFTARGITAYCLCLFIIYPLLLLLTYTLIKIRPVFRRRKNHGSPTGNSVQIKCFLFTMIPLFVMLWGYYPTIMTTDGLSQWGQATGVWGIADSHPAIHTLFIKFCSLLAKTPYMVSVMQILLFSILWSFIMRYLHQSGNLNAEALYIISFVTASIPTNYMMLFLVSKNILYGIIVLCTTFMFIKLWGDETYLQYKIVFLFGIDLSLLYLVRHNGFIGTIVSCVIILSMALYQLSKRKILNCIKLCSILVVMAACIAIIRGPVYSYFQVLKNGNTFAYGPLSEAVGIFYLADREIPAEVKDTVDRIGTKEQWLQYYNPYDGDKLGWSELKNTMVQVDKKEMLSLYFTLLKNDPLLVIKARLHSTDLLWNIFEPVETYRHYGGHNNSYYGGMTVDPGYEEKFPDLLKEEYRQSNGDYLNVNIVTIACRRLNSISYQNESFQAIFWRNGIYVVIMLWLFIINILEKNRKILIAGLVPMATLGSLALAASWQIYQYYWFFPLCVLLLALVTVAERKDLIQTENQES